MIERSESEQRARNWELTGYPLTDDEESLLRNLDFWINDRKKVFIRKYINEITDDLMYGKKKEEHVRKNKNKREINK